MHLFNSDSEHAAFASSSNYKEPYVGAINSAASHVYYNVSEGITPHYIDEKPYDSEIEYLQSSGTQYINTNIKAGTYTYYFKGYLNNNTSAVAFGAGSTSVLGIWAGAYVGLQYGSNKQYYNAAGSNVSYSVNNINEIIVTPNYLEVNGTKYNYDKTYTISSNNTVYLFSDNNNYRFKNRIYAFKIINGNNTLLDLIPVRKGTVGYMYDRISGTLYGNNGSGSFILGPDIDTNVLPYDNEVEYLYTDGNSYISLPINCDDNTDCVEMCFRRTAETAQHRFYGDSAGQIMVTYVNDSKAMAYNTITTSNASSWTALNNTYNKPGLVQHIIKTDYKNNKVYFDFDPYTMPTRNKKVATSNSFLITGKMGSSPGMVGNVYYVKYWRNNELIYDLVPVKKDGYGCFYDKIHNVIYRSSGSKDYTAGIDKYKKLSDYTQLTYIENTTFTATSPYIDCQLNSSLRPYKFEATIKWNVSGSSKRQLFGANGTNGAYWGNENGVYKTQNSTTLSDTPSTTEFKKVTTPNITVTTSGMIGSMLLFRIYEPSNKSNVNTTYISSCKLGRYKIWANNILVRDFIPVQHPSGRYGMFENVEKKFYDSANTGNFTGG